MLADFLNSVTVVFSTKFATKPMTHQTQLCQVLLFSGRVCFDSLCISHRPRTRGRTVRETFDEQCLSNHFQNRPRYRPVDDRQRTVRDRLIEGCRLQTARTGLCGCRAGRTTLAPRHGDRGDVLGWMWKLFQGMTVL